MPWANQTEFEEIYRCKGATSATSWLYEQSKQLGLIHQDGTSSGAHWQHESVWGPLLISINEAKPEKDPRDIAAAVTLESSSKPLTDTCVFCWDSTNEVNHLRIRLSLQEKPYSLHYSPYAYFPEHCIVSTEEHRPMLIDKRTFDDLLELCSIFPDYFFGSNADLPIVGGSILNHHHYQGGRFAFPLEAAALLQTIDLPESASVSAALMKWPLTCIRLTGADRHVLASVANSILHWWKHYDDPAAGIVSTTPDGCQHNTITPIARKRDDLYELDLILRCNITSFQHPLGVFHPHEEVHCVKKENIGLIEAMGLAILPPRVRTEFDVVDSSLPNDREKVGDLFTLGLEQCGVLTTEASRTKAINSLIKILSTTHV